MDTAEQPTQLVVIKSEPKQYESPLDPDWDIQINVLQWKMRQKREFLALLNTGGTNKDDSALYPFYALMVKKWPYALDPSVESNYDEISVEEFNEVTRRVIATFQQAADQS